MSVISSRKQNTNISRKRKKTAEEEEYNNKSRSKKRDSKRIQIINKHDTAEKNIKDNSLSKQKEHDNYIHEKKSFSVGPVKHKNQGGQTDIKKAALDIAKSADYTVKMAGKQINSISSKEKNDITIKRIGIESRREAKISDEDSVDYSGIRSDVNSQEYAGHRTARQDNNTSRIDKKIAGTIVSVVMIFAKAMTSSIIIILVIACLIGSLIATITISILKSVTYNFIADEEYLIRENIASITYDLDLDINTMMQENGCVCIQKSGELEWKTPIAAWWTVKQSGLDISDEYDDKELLALIFDAFNVITYDVSENNILSVNISNDGIEAFENTWNLNDECKDYISELLNDNDIWTDILGVTELASISSGERGNDVEIYQSWYGDAGYDNSAIFVNWCLEQTGCLVEGFIDKAGYSNELLQQIKDIGFGCDKDNYKPIEGDIIFLIVNNQVRSGIVNSCAGDYVSAIVCDYKGSGKVEELTLDLSDQDILYYGHIYGFYVQSLATTYIASDQAQMLVDAALAYKDYHEKNTVDCDLDSFVTDCDGSGNITKFHRDLKNAGVNTNQGDAWCSIFVTAMFYETGLESYISDVVKKGCAYSGNYLIWGKENGYLVPVTEGQCGDLIIFDYTRDGVYDHIGFIVEKNASGGYITIEGNYANKVSKVTRNNYASIAGIVHIPLDN